VNLNIFYAILIFVIGACLGSFLSVVISRISLGKKGILMGRSECPDCRHQLAAQNLVPVFSWIFQKGRCQYCHKPISPVYPALELSSGLLFLTSYFSLAYPLFELNHFFVSFDLSWLKLIYLELLNLILIAISFSDLQTRQIPNLFLTIWIVLTIPALLIQDWFSSGLALLICMGFLGGQWLVSRGRWLGSGDIYFSIGMAFLLGWQRTIVALVLSYFLGSIIAVLLLLTGKAGKKSPLAFAPFLVLGTLLAFYFGQDIINWYIGTTNL
jgi:leader peptidase (prepilin peptidase)/N-methyltransferase